MLGSVEFAAASKGRRGCRVSTGRGSFVARFDPGGMGRVVNLLMASRTSGSSGNLFSAHPVSGRSPSAHPAAAGAYTAHVDGGARGNPGPAGYGVSVQDGSGKPVAELSEYLGHHTNNYAEYQGLIAALRYAAKNQIKALKVVSDSELMVRQMKGVYKVRHPELRKLYDEAQMLVRQMEYFEIRHALREHNQIADRLANEAMDRGR